VVTRSDRAEGGGELMMQSWSMERMAEQRRQDLNALSRRGREASAGCSPQGAALFMQVQPDEAEPTPAQPVRSAQLAAAGTRPARRPLGQHVGTLLIRAGTRLGGASMRTS
jgi:hypothetical protein